LIHLAMSRFSIVGSFLAVVLILSIVAPSAGASTPLVLAQQKRQVVITAMLDNLGNVIKWDGLLQPAIQELKARHPDLNI
jgi:hypothetical protein